MSEVELLDGDWKPSKKKKSIDGIVALVMGLDRAGLADPGANLTVYEREGRGFLAIG